MPHQSSPCPTYAEYSEALARRNSGDYLNFPASLVVEDHETITRYEKENPS